MNSEKMFDVTNASILLDKIIPPSGENLEFMQNYNSIYPNIALNLAKEKILEDNDQNISVFRNICEYTQQSIIKNNFVTSYIIRASQLNEPNNLWAKIILSNHDEINTELISKALIISMEEYSKANLDVIDNVKAWKKISEQINDHSKDT